MVSSLDLIVARDHIYDECCRADAKGGSPHYTNFSRKQVSGWAANSKIVLIQDRVEKASLSRKIAVLVSLKRLTINIEDLCYELGVRQ
jgi:hypothetical protein